MWCRLEKDLRPICGIHAIVDCPAVLAFFHPCVARAEVSDPRRPNLLTLNRSEQVRRAFDGLGVTELWFQPPSRLRLREHIIDGDPGEQETIFTALGDQSGRCAIQGDWLE